jgi:hypothetical protein
MYPRTEYEMTEEDLRQILDASKPTVCMKIGSYTGSTPQENANRAWEALGNKMGFDYMTVRPISGKGQRFFTAVPSETKEQKEEREKIEKENKRLEKIAKLKAEIIDREEQLKELEK